MSTTHFIEPLDVLFLRGNKLFGDAGSFGESLIPPWPSVAAGAIRSALAVHKGIDLARFARGEERDPELGTPAEPGPFTVTAFHLARRHGEGRVEPLFPLPADLVVAEGDRGDTVVRRLAPGALPGTIASSYGLPLLPVLAEPERGKPVRGDWLTEAGWRACLGGKTPAADKLVPASELWALDTRVGVGLDPARRRAANGRLFTVQGVAFASQAARATADVGFLVRVAGAVLPAGLTLRLGGDGRAALSWEVSFAWPEPDYAAIAAARRCRLILTSPAIFEHGWLPTGVRWEEGSSYRFDLHGVRGRLAAAAVPRAAVVSGWDLAQGRPKPARRVAPAGAVYWLDELDATSEALRRLVEHGLWDEPREVSRSPAEGLPPADGHRRSEGFNRLSLGRWS
jgi:CRISPR-associated protein Cmr3